MHDHCLANLKNLLSIAHLRMFYAAQAHWRVCTVRHAYPPRHIGTHDKQVTSTARFPMYFLLSAFRSRAGHTKKLHLRLSAELFWVYMREGRTNVGVAELCLG